MSWGLGGFKNIVKINSLSVPVLKEIWRRGREVTFTKCLLFQAIYIYILISISLSFHNNVVR